MPRPPPTCWPSPHKHRLPEYLRWNGDAIAREFTDDDQNKDIVTVEGDHIGTVRDVNDGRATIDRDQNADLMDKIKDLIGWGDDDSNELRSDHVDSYEDDRVRFRRP